MAAGMFPSTTRSQYSPCSFSRLPSSFSHGSPSFPRGHADQGGRPGAGSPAALLGGGDGGSRGGAAGWSILESWRPAGVNGGGAARGGVDGALLTCRVCFRSFHGPEALYLHMRICQPAPAAAAAAPAAPAQPPALPPQQDRENMLSMVLEVLRPIFPRFSEEDLVKPWFAVFVRAAVVIVSMSAGEPAVYRGPVYVKRLAAAMVLQAMPKAPAVPTYSALNFAVLAMGPTAISDPYAAAATVAIAPAPRAAAAAAAAATLAPAPFVPAARAPKAYAAPLATPDAFGRGSSGAGAGAGEMKKVYECSLCDEKFRSGQALGGHVTGRHRRATTSVLDRIPAANIGTPSTSIAMRKRPATEAASPGNAKRRCIRLFGVDIAVGAPKE